MLQKILWASGLLLLADYVLEDNKVKKVFISFDYDNDEFLRTALVGQAKNPDTPFVIIDRSLKEPLSGDWKAKVKTRIDKVDIVVVMCGEKTHTADGVAAEVRMAQELGKPYFLLRGYGSKTCTPPTAAKSTDKMYTWTWENLKILIGGAR
jgi:hypothetical protein